MEFTSGMQLIYVGTVINVSLMGVGMGQVLYWGNSVSCPW
jgi:hypothetical protein